MLRYLFGWLLFSIPAFMLAQTGCPGCEVVLPDLAADTIYISNAPNGEVGLAYDEDLSFRLPMSTTPVSATDPTVPAGLPIDEITIIGVANVPPGLSWEANQLNFMVADETDGCVKFCGTPLVAVNDTIQVIIEARISFISQQTTVGIPIQINPAQQTTEGFSVVNTSGCGSVTSTFTNNIPSGGAEGFSYLWFFNNGNSTTEENPAEQLYTQVGEHIVNYQAIVDTAGFFMTEVTIEASPCTDIFSNPDLKFDLFDPNGEVVYTAPIVDNVNLPVSYQLLFQLEEGEYELHVIDDDGGLDGGDDLCGIIPFNRESGGMLMDGDLIVNIGLIHPVDTIRSTETITVFPIPAVPQVSILGEDPYCEGESIQLVVNNYTDNLEWFMDSSLVVNTNTDTLTLTQSGSYSTTYTSADGCEVTSFPTVVAFTENPEEFELQQNENLLRMVDESNLPADFTFTWSYEGEIISEATSLLLCAEATGLYSLTIVDALTGCSTMASIEADYNPSISCSTPTAEIEGNAHWAFFPNPIQNYLYIDGPQRDDLHLWLYDAYGRLLHQAPIQTATQAVDLSAWPAGVYFYQLHSKNTSQTADWKPAENRLDLTGI